MDKRIPRQAFKGIKTIPYPSDDIIQLWASKEYAGEIRLKDEDGRWDFNPPLQITDIENLENSVIELLENNSNILLEDINPTITVGGITAGVSLLKGTGYQDLFKKLLTPYQTSFISNFIVSLIPAPIQGIIYEVGTPVAIGNATFNITLDSDRLPPKDFRITGTGFEGIHQSSPIVSNLSETVFNTVETKQWSLVGKNSKGNDTNTLTFSRSSQWRYYFGGRPALNVTALQQSWLNPNQARTVICTTDNQNFDNFTYIVYNSIYPDLVNIILNGAAPVLGAFTKQPDVFVVNRFGVSHPYKVYKSNATGAFATGDTLTIS